MLTWLSHVAAFLTSRSEGSEHKTLRLLPNALQGDEQIVCDKGYAGREFAAEVEARFAAEILRPKPEAAVDLSMIRQ